MLLLTDNQPTVPNQQQEGHAHHQQHTDPSGTLRTLEDEPGQRRGGKVEATTFKPAFRASPNRIPMQTPKSVKRIGIMTAAPKPMI